jgi:Ca-activated chloride channel family protein
MRGRILVIALAAVAVAVAFTASKDDARQTARDRAARTVTPAAGSIRLDLRYSPEKAGLMKSLVDRFNASRTRSDGRPVFIDGRSQSSGEVENLIARGRLKPELWSPASSLWGRLLNYQSDDLLVGDRNPSIVRTPLVIAMWKRLADAYGYPRRKLGFSDLARLATGGWAAVGRPGFGAFQYVHTNPDFSTSGLSAVTASYYAAVGKREGLTEADVTRARPAVRRLERSIVHYGDITDFIAQEMRRHGLDYASAAAMEETTLIAFNRSAGDGERLVAVYPKEGTFYSDSPLITLRGDWVTPQERRAAATFASFVTREVTPELAGRYGFRPADPRQAPAGLVSAANGVDPRQPASVLELPDPKVLARIKSAWRSDRKPANVMIVIDNSGSMSKERLLDHAKAGVKTFLKAVTRNDRVGLNRFSHTTTRMVPIAPMAENRAKLQAAVDSIRPDDDTALRQAVLDGVADVEKTADKNAINAVVVLTDGEDNSTSGLTEERVVQELERQQERARQVRVFTIAYGSKPDEQELNAYAVASGGNSYKADQSDVESIYRQISSFF